MTRAANITILICFFCILGLMISCDHDGASTPEPAMYLDYRQEALICAVAWRDTMGDITRIVSGPCIEEDCDHVQAQALVDGEWKFLRLTDDKGIEVTNQDYWYEVGDFLCLYEYLDWWYWWCLDKTLCPYIADNLIWEP